VEKHLYPFIPCYILRYEKEIKSGAASIDNVIMDLEYLKKGLKEALENGFISSYDEANIRAYMNTIIKHVTNGNKNEERLVNIVGGTVIVTEADKIYRNGQIEKEKDIILTMLKKGKTMDEIYSLTDIPMETIKSFVSKDE
jgi:hypothetical protein